MEDARTRWGTRELAADQLAVWAAPSMAEDPAAIEWFATFMRVGGSPGSAVALELMNYEIDVRDVLPTIQVRRSWSIVRATGTSRPPGAT